MGSKIEYSDHQGDPGAKAPQPNQPLAYWNNVITLCGMFLAIISVMLLGTFALFTFVKPATNPYVDIVGFMVLPGLLIIALILMPLGILFKSWRRRRLDPTQKLVVRFPKFDLNDPAQRRVAKVFVGGTFIFLPAVGVSSYHGYHYTDSAEFCSKACHAVMEPEATTFAQSPHARVACAECHIGEGADWFVKSKLSGTRQVFAMFRKSYSRPIEPAIHHLRPARETCERCHWPDKFYGAQLKKIPKHAPDEDNTNRDVIMLLKIGGGGSYTGQEEGIHWHVVNNIEYVATDPHLQEIPWVKKTDKDGKETVFRSDGLPASAPPPDGQRRTLDCMDCHNRPAHEFVSPQESVDSAIDGGLIAIDLPFVKKTAVKLLSQHYEDVESAEKAIEEGLTSYYEQNHPAVYADKRDQILFAVDTVKKLYRTNTFPYMRVDWKTYPDNIGHLNFPGCFRCHDDKHVSDAGGVIDTRCDECHTFLNEQTRDDGTTFLAEGQFEHPTELTGVHAALRCDQCHDGGPLPEATCTGCHSETQAFITATSPVFSRFHIEPDSMADSVSCDICHDVSEPIDLEVMNESCLDCHDDDEDRFDGMVDEWRKEVDALFSKARAAAGQDQQDILEALRRAGPMHNMEATRAILKTIGEPKPGKDDVSKAD